MTTTAPPVSTTPRRSPLLWASTGTTGASAVTVVTGLMLDVSIAARFGAGHATDAFFVAQRLPVGVATVVLGGMNLSLVPIIGTWIGRKGLERASAHLVALVTVLTVASAAVCVPIAIGAPWIVRAMAPGMSAADVATASSMLPLLLLVVPLTATAEVLRAALNARHSFVQPALLNAALNVTAVAVVIGFARSDIRVVAWAYVGGAIARVLLALPLVWRAGYRCPAGAVTAAHRDTEAWHAIRLSLRPALAASLAPGMRLVEQGFTSFLPAGSITLLAYGYRLVFALGGTVFFRSIVGVLVPSLTEATVADDVRRVRRLVVQGFRAMTAVSVGLVTLLATLAVPISLVLFHRGGFTRDKALLLGDIIAVLALSLVGEAWQRVLLAPMYARLDMRTPLRNALLGAGTELVLLPALVLPWGRGHGALFGIAVAFVLSEYVGPVHAWLKLRSRIGPLHIGWRSLGGSVVVAGAFATAVALAARVGLGLTTTRPALVSAVLVAVAAIAVGAAYVSVIYLFARRASWTTGLARLEPR